MADKAVISLGSIGETEVRIVAFGPKAGWATDVLSEKFKAQFASIKQQAERELKDDAE